MIGNENKTEKFQLDPELTIFEEVQDVGENTIEILKSLKKVDSSIEELKKKYKLPIKGKDYFTSEDIQSILNLIQSKIDFPEDGYTPIKGKDYFTSEEHEEFLNNLTASLIKLLPKSAKEQLEELKGNDGLDISHIKGLEKFFSREVIQRQGQNKGGIWQGSANPLAVISGSSVYKDIRSLTFPEATIVNRNGDVTITIAGGGGSSFETPVGIIDGSNATFTVSNTPKAVILNGLTYFENDGYTLSGLIITMLVVPVTGSTFRSLY